MAIKKIRPKTRARDGIKNFGKIGILMGGPSTEREVSLKSGKAVLEALKEIHPDVRGIDIVSDSVEENTGIIRESGINCAFLALHGRFGEDGQIQQILDNLGMPYTGSGALASRLAMDKLASRKIFQVYGLTVPKYKKVDKFSYNRNSDVRDKFPLAVKPSSGGSSIGLSIVDRKEDFRRAMEEAFSVDDHVLIEEYVEGRELTVGILDEQALPVVEIIPKKRFFDYEAKYHAGFSEYVVPAELDESVSRKVRLCALSAHKLLGCSGCSRVDIILRKDNLPFVLEVNTIPGLTSTSLLPKAARSVGIEFRQLCLKLIELAYEKT